MYIGIDPGISGAIVCLNNNGLPSSFTLMPFLSKDGKKILDIEFLSKELVKLKQYEPKVWMEKVHAMPKQGVSSMFKFGFTVGATSGVLHALGINFDLVSPQIWTKAMHVKEDLPSKEKSLKAFLKLWPHMDDFLMKMPKYKREAIVDAALIARWGYERVRHGHVIPPDAQGFASPTLRSTSSLRRKSAPRSKQKGHKLLCDPSS